MPKHHISPTIFWRYACLHCAVCFFYQNCLLAVKHAHVVPAISMLLTPRLHTDARPPADAQAYAYTKLNVCS